MASTTANALTIALLTFWIGTGSGLPIPASVFLPRVAPSPTSPPPTQATTGLSNHSVICFPEGTQLVINKTTGEIHVLPPSSLQTDQMAAEQVAHFVSVVNVETPYSNEQEIVSFIVFGYVSTLCVFAFLGMIGVAVVTCRQNSRASACRRGRDGYQSLE